MLKLPIEMQAEIFNYFTPVERQKLRAICRAWDFVIGQLFEIQLNVVELAPLLHTKARFLSVRFAGISDSRFHRSPLLISFCARIQTLTLVGFTLTLNCSAILRHCSSVKKLVIENILLSSLKFSRIFPNARKLRTWLPELEYLRFRCGAISESDSHLLSVLANVLEPGKLQKLCVNVKQNVSFDFVNTKYITGKNTDQTKLPEPATPDSLFELAVNKILFSNRKTLRHIRIESSQGTSFNYKSLYIDTYQPNKESSELHIKGFTSVDMLLLPNLQPSHWLQVVSSQKYLQQLSLTSYDKQSLFSWSQEIISDIILKNAATLTMIDLDLAATVIGHKPSWDVEVFSKCKNLKQLDLRLWPMHTYNYYVLAGYIPCLHNIEQLPTSLQHFATNFTIASPANEIQNINLNNLRNLRTLQLFGIPWFTLNGQHKLGLTLRDFYHIVAKLPNWRLVYLMVNQYGRFDVSGRWRVLSTLSSKLLKKSHKTETIDGEMYIKLTNSKQAS